MKFALSLKIEKVSKNLDNQNKIVYDESHEKMETILQKHGLSGEFHNVYDSSQHTIYKLLFSRLFYGTGFFGVCILLQKLQTESAGPYCIR